MAAVKNMQNQTILTTELRKCTKKFLTFLAGQQLTICDVKLGIIVDAHVEIDEMGAKTSVQFGNRPFALKVADHVFLGVQQLCACAAI